MKGRDSEELMNIMQQILKTVVFFGMLKVMESERECRDV